MFRPAAIGLLGAVLASCGADDPRPTRLKALFDQVAADGSFSGAVVAGIDGRILFEAGYGLANIETGAPFTPETASDGGSIAKTVTAALVTELDKEGVLSLGANIRSAVPEYPFDGTTHHHFLGHLSGWFRDYSEIGPPSDGETSNDDLLANLSGRPPEATAPGARFIYNNIAYDLAALAAERATGERYAALVGERFFDRLGMKDAFIRPAKFVDWPGVRTMSYRKSGAALELFEIFDGEAFYGGSNIYFSARDLFRWGSGWAAEKAVSLQAAEKCAQPVRLNDGAATGINACSWYKDGDARYYTGDLQGFYSIVWWDSQSGAAFAFVSNSAMPNWLRPKLPRAAATILRGGVPGPIAPPPSSPLTVDLRADAVGAYDLGIGVASVAFSETEGAVVKLGGVSYDAFKVDDATLYVPGVDLWLTFTRIPGGVVLHASGIDGVRSAARL